MSENVSNSTNSIEQLTSFPKRKWIIMAFGAWLLLGIIPMILVLVGTNIFSAADNEMTAVAGTIGDAFGLANSLFAAGALLFVVWSIRLQQQEISFARHEWHQNTEPKRIKRR